MCNSSTRLLLLHFMVRSSLPTSQRELLLAARGSESQEAFARRLGIDRTCLSRYERERLGVPISVLNHCLRAIAGAEVRAEASPVDRALEHVRQAAQALHELSATSDTAELSRRQSK